MKKMVASLKLCFGDKTDLILHIYTSNTILVNHQCQGSEVIIEMYLVICVE